MIIQNGMFIFSPRDALCSTWLLLLLDMLPSALWAMVQWRRQWPHAWYYLWTFKCQLNDRRCWNYRTRMDWLHMWVCWRPRQHMQLWFLEELTLSWRRLINLSCGVGVSGSSSRASESRPDFRSIQWRDERKSEWGKNLSRKEKCRWMKEKRGGKQKNYPFRQPLP